MLFQRINRSNPEKVFIVAYNSYSTASLTNGQTANWDMTDKDGVSVGIAVASAKKHFGRQLAGIAAETIAHTSYGLIQVYGYHSAVRVRTFSAPSTAGAAPVAVGVALSQITTAFCLESFPAAAKATSTTTQVQFHIGALALAAQASWTTGYCLYYYCTLVLNL